MNRSRSSRLHPAGYTVNRNNTIISNPRSLLSNNKTETLHSEEILNEHDIYESQELTREMELIIDERVRISVIDVLRQMSTPDYFYVYEVQTHYRNNREDVRADWLLETPIATNYSINKTTSVVSKINDRYSPSTLPTLTHLSIIVPEELKKRAVIILNAEQQRYLLLLA